MRFSEAQDPFKRRKFFKTRLQLIARKSVALMKQNRCIYRQLTQTQEKMVDVDSTDHVWMDALDEQMSSNRKC